MATLTGTTIQSTYDSLLKVTDNDAITSSLKRITDGLGNNTPLFLSNTAVEISSGLNVVGSITGANLSGTNTGDETKSSIETKLGVASASNSGFLSSSDWSTFNNKIAGVGTLNRVSKFSSTGSIADSNISDNGTLVSISTATTITGNLTATNIIRSGGTSSQFLKADGSVDSTSYQPLLTNPVTGTGTTNTLPKFTGASAIGNSNITDTGSLITLGSNSFVNGALGIGTTTLAGVNLNVTRSLTGATNFFSTTNQGSVLSDVTRAYYYDTFAGVQNTAFTLTELVHYNARGTGAFGSATVTEQAGYKAGASLVGATNNFGFLGQIPAGTGNWNLYMNGTANNYMLGGLGIGQTALTGHSLRVGRNITGATTSFGLRSDGQVQSDVTGVAYYFDSTASTQATTFTLGNLTHYRAAQGTFGAGSTVTDQHGFLVASSLIGAGWNYGFRGQIPAGTNRWNLFMDGTANNYINGALGISATSLTGFHINIGRTLTGSVTSRGIHQSYSVGSDVTNAAIINSTSISTQAAAFTLPQLTHYYASQVTIGAGSTVTNQNGFRVDNTLVGATNNYAFKGEIPSGTGRWNLFMDGTANNHLAGSLGIGSTSLTGYNIRMQKTITGAATAWGMAIESAIQSDVTGTVRVFSSNPTTQATAFTLTNLYHYAASSQTLGAGSTVTTQAGFFAGSGLTTGTNNYGFQGDIPSGTGRWNLFMSGTARNYLAGTLSIGSTVDNATGAILQVTGSATFSSSITASSIIRSGGTSSQFLKADGSVDSTSYQPLLTNPITGTGTAGRIPVFATSSTLGDSQIFTAFDETAGAMIGIGATPNASPIPSRLYVSGASYMAGSITATGAISTTESITASSIVRSGGTSAQLLAANGSVVTAGTNITISGGTISANNTSQWITSGSNIYYNTGNVGIGTTSPATLLDLFRASYPVLQISSGTVTGNIGIDTASNFLNVGASSNHPLVLATNNAERMRITSGGNVGIGTTNPDQRLTIGSGNGISIRTVSGGTYGSLRFGTNESTWFDAWAGIDSDWEATGVNVANLRFYTSFGSRSERMRITSGGNVGIGVTNPSNNLEVARDVLIGANRWTNDAGATVFNIWGSSSSSTSAQINLTQVWNGISYPVILRNIYNPVAGAASSLFTLSTTQWNGSTAFTTERLRIDGNTGNVGIGTSSPSGATNYTTVHIAGQTTALGGAVRLTTSDGSAAAVLTTNIDGGYLGMDGSLPFRFATNSTEQMRITSGGNVGIGTSSPTTLLDVRGFISSIGGSGSNGYQLGDYGSDAGTFSISARSGRNLVFRDEFAGTERMRITSGGNVGIGQSNPSARLAIDGGGLLVNTNGTISANCTASFRARTGTATDRTLEAFSISYSALFYLQNNGSYFFAGSNLSDARAKKDITYFNEPILDKVMQLKPASFRYTQNDENIKGGFIAQEVKEIFPDLVTKTQDEDDLMGVDYYGVIALLTKAVQELKQEIEELKNK